MLVENATSAWGQSREWVLHKHSCIQFIALVPSALVLWTVCTCACAKPIPEIVPMLKLDIGKMQKQFWYYEKWVGRHASFPLRQSVKRSQLCELVILQTVMYLDTLKNYLPKIVQSSFKFHKRMMFPYYTCTSRCHCTSILECKFVDYWSGVGGEGIYYAFSGYAKREFLGFAPFFFSLWSPKTIVE